MKEHCQKGLRAILKSFLILGSLMLASSVYAQDEAPAELTEIQKAGSAIFEAECRTCHNFGSDATGPKLAGVTKRQSNEWLTKWIDNPAKVIASGDKHAVELKAKWGSVMPTIGLEADEIVAVIDYLSVGADPVVAKGPSPIQGAEGAVVTSTDNSSINTVLGVVLVVLILIILVLVLLASTISKTLKQKESAGEISEIDSEYMNQTHSVLKVLKHPAFLGGAAIVLLALGAWFGVTKGLYGIGVQQGYQPTQPIAFSHKLHAGEHKIDCNYCHTGVRKAKHANIPAASICMNCHIKIKTESNQIAQIYKAIDYDKETKTFGNNIKPIQWVRIHNLPDHVYFNHSQHTKVAGLECEECHGPIDEMAKVYQYSPLTMGWCIDCHRKTKVTHAQDNDYYESLIKAHDEAGKDSKEMTVEDIGGLECGRCHY